MDAEAKQIAIGPEFFRNAFRDYNDPYWAFAREIIQNAIDARSTKIDICVRDSGSDTEITVKDDGCGMTREVLETKLLSLGSSGKGFAGTVGGFGKAKEILLFAQKRYSIHTLDNFVEGCGARYTISKREAIKGTTIVVVSGGDLTRTHLTEAFRSILILSTWSGRAILNGTVIPTALRRGSFKREFGFGRVYVNRELASVVVVRIGGIPMFRYGTTFKGCVVVELPGSSLATLTANRDGLRYPYREELGRFTEALAIDKRSALREQKSKYLNLDGRIFEIEASEPVNESVASSLAGAVAAAALGMGQVVLLDSAVRTSSRVPFRFVLKNTTGMETPSYFRPDSPDWGSYSAWLIQGWADALVKLHRIYKRSAKFSVGFVLDEESQAEFEHNPSSVFLINPAVVVKQASGSRSFRKRFKRTDRFEILATLAHEFVHSLGFPQHDEDYASKLSEVSALMMRHLKEFVACF